ncbi:MAG: YajQ family cyclic di-GMP-binding protein [SAR324 cluster bacterium]|nr:YajQ family cyclic di-GMP-binding protein [SAR324 cluster bacterium]
MSSCSFDIVCEVNLQELDNGVNQAKREIETRYDFKGSHCEIELDKEKSSVLLTADDDMKMKMVIDILLTKLIKRSVPVKSIVYGKTEPTGRLLKKTLTVQQGLSKEQCKKITTCIKDSKLKVQAQVMGEQVRVTGKSKDDLQQIMGLLKGMELDFDLQFTNYR